MKLWVMLNDYQIFRVRSFRHAERLGFSVDEVIITGW